MITIALHDSIKLEDKNVREAIFDVAEELEIAQPSFFDFTAPIDFVEKAASAGGHVIDMVILPFNLPGISGAKAVAEARMAQPKLKSLMIADDPDNAAEAAACGVDAYLVSPVVARDFERAAAKILAQVNQIHGGSIMISSRGSAARIAHDEILYCETSGHDQIIHLVGGSDVAGRYSSQAMFDLLSGDARFFKAGSSYIVNLHEIVEARSGNGTVFLSDGTVLNIPSRLRKGLEAALLAL